MSEPLRTGTEKDYQYRVEPPTDTNVFGPKIHLEYNFGLWAQSSCPTLSVRLRRSVLTSASLSLPHHKPNRSPPLSLSLSLDLQAPVVLLLHLPHHFCELPGVPFPNDYPEYPTKHRHVHALRHRAGALAGVRRGQCLGGGNRVHRPVAHLCWR